MKNIVKEAASKILADRYVLVLCILLVLLSLAFAVYIAISVRPSDLQIVSHYSAFGRVNIYLDRWYYLLSFGVMALAIAAIHMAISAKILLNKSRYMAILWLWASIAMIAFAWMSAYSVLNIWSRVV